jgi:hypothetical protein
VRYVIDFILGCVLAFIAYHVGHAQSDYDAKRDHRARDRANMPPAPTPQSTTVTLYEGSRPRKSAEDK